LPRARRRDPEAVAEALRRAIRAALSAAWNKKPLCHVHVLEVGSDQTRHRLHGTRAGKPEIAR
jgi:hypothetical protein